MAPAGFQLNPTFSFTLLGTFAIYLWTGPPRRAWLWLLLLAVLLREGCAEAMGGGFGDYFGAAWISWGTFLGLATLAVLVIQSILTRGDTRRSHIRTFYAGSVFPLLGIAVGLYFPLNVRLYPKTLDSFLLAFDGSLGFLPSFVLGRIAGRNHTLWHWTTVVYYAVPFAASLLYASHRMRKRQTAPVLPLLLSFMIAGVAQYGIYPAVGPAHAFREIYPWNSPPLREILLQPMMVGGEPRNCMPSLHFGTALLVWWNSRIWPAWGRMLAMLFLLLTAFSTLALGEHYLADLVVAFPVALAFQAAWTTAVPSSLPERYVPVVAGVSLSVIWLVLLRYSVPAFELSPVGTWASVLVTMGSCIWLERKLAVAANNLGKAPVRVLGPVSDSIQADPI